MTGRGNEINASVNAIVDQLVTIDTILLFKKRIETSFNIFKDGFPAVMGFKGEYF